MFTFINEIGFLDFLAFKLVTNAVYNLFRIEAGGRETGKIVGQLDKFVFND